MKMKSNPLGMDRHMACRKYLVILTLVFLSSFLTSCGTNNAPTVSPSTSSVAGRDWYSSTLDAEFAPREGFLCVAFANRLWVIAGATGGSILFNDVWCSWDGSRWRQVLADAGSPGSGQFSQRGTSGVVFQNKMWVIGGGGADGSHNDVWSSSDGVSWNCVLPNAVSPGPNQFSPRGGNASLVYNDKIWVIGGGTYGNLTNDVWCSPDGVHWTQVLADSGSPGPNQFSRRFAHKCLVHQNKMWLIGGADSTYTALNDVWSSADGVSWTQVLPNTATPPSTQFSKRNQHACLEFDGAMWVIGGDGNDVWDSTDGLNWTRVTASANFPGRYDHCSVVFRNEMWVIGGFDSYIGLFNDVWHSP